jgi:hypothetical protein
MCSIEPAWPPATLPLLPSTLNQNFLRRWSPVSYPFQYHSLAGALQYITLTRLEISYVVHQVCLHMHDPRETHFSLIKRILRYLKGTLDLGLILHSSSTHNLVAYSDADWAGCPDTRRSTSKFCVFLEITWFHGRLAVNRRSLAAAPRLSTKQLHLVLPRHACSITCC